MLEDSYSRKINYLRLSITDMCNLRCIYCRPKEEVEWKTHQEILRYEEIVKLVSLMAQLGIRRIRLTGGEPLIRKDVIHLINDLAKIELLEELSLTTNATLLPKFAWQIKKAGVNRVNISLDSLNKERYLYITGGGNLDNVLAGIEEAIKAGLDPLKINMVVMQGINDDEIEAFVRLTINRPIHVRFIELMPLGKQREKYLPSFVLKERLSNYYELIPTNDLPGNGPAEYYRINGALGRIGFITPMSNNFCSRCNRIRLTPDGYLRPCLGENEEFDLKSLLRQGASDSELKGFITKVVKHKPKSHRFHQTKWKNTRQMINIGG